MATNKNTEPIKTCKPWKPVAIKKVAPKEVSEIEKGAVKYSKAWNSENTNPNLIVRFKDKTAILKDPFSKAWCLHVTATPEDKRRIVFNKGILIGLKGKIPIGGQDCPTSTTGEILLCKKAQKKARKKNTSEMINKIIPVFRPLITKSECCPWELASRWTSFHQR